MKTSIAAALTLAVGLAFSGVVRADPPGGAPAKPAATGGTNTGGHSHKPKLKQTGKKAAANPEPGADKAGAMPPAAPAK